MKKRILCAILTVVMLVSLVPATALTAFAATNKVSESAITVLKQLQGYTSYCTSKGYTGYGTPCTVNTKKEGAHGNATNGNGKGHFTGEKAADQALRAELTELDKAVNGFASANGLSLKQNQHDALVLFSFRNGTAWISGTGDVKRAVTTRATGNDFLNMYCNWRGETADNNRRLIEANMYLNGVYSTAVSSKYIRVQYEPNGGTMVGNKTTYYYDWTLSDSELPTPTREGYVFTGWYNGYADADNIMPTNWVHKLSDLCKDVTLTAQWQDAFETPDKDASQDEKNELLSFDYNQNKVRDVDYILPTYLMASGAVYETPDHKATSGIKIETGETHAIAEYIDRYGVKWCQIDRADKYTYTDENGKRQTCEPYVADGFENPYWWVKAGVGLSGGGTTVSGGTSVDVTVTVTNSFVNSRVNASITSAKNGSYSQGAKLRIIDTKQGSGFLWGQIAKSAEDNKPIGWVALMYTDYESVIAGKGNTTANNGSVIAKARINAPVNGYVNVRDGAGTDNNIVGSVSYDTLVDIYEIKYVNGFQWGRCDRGWFALAYADVTRLVAEKNETTQTGYTSYAFTGKILDKTELYHSPNGEYVTEDELAEMEKDKSAANKLYDGKNVTVTNVTADASGNVWGKISEGWIQMFDGYNYDAYNFEMDVAKYEVTADSATVRTEPNTAASRVDSLTKGVEFNVTRIAVDGATLWGYSDKVGDASNNTYSGWVNLSSRYVKRNNAPYASSETTGSTSPAVGGTATIKGAEEVNVRSKASIHGGLVCKVKEGSTYTIAEGPVNSWYRLTIPGYSQDTWVYDQYLTINASGSGSSSSASGGKVETGKGIVANTYAGVNVRSTPGIGGAFVGKILTGTAVDILEVKQVGSSKWGRVSQGWICMDYVTMISYEDIPGASGSNGSNGGASGNTVTGAQTAIYTGHVEYTDGSGIASYAMDAVDEISETGDVTVNGRDSSDNMLLVFKTTDINSDIVRRLDQNDPVTVHELLTVEETKEKNGSSTSDDNTGSETSYEVIKRNTYWARVNDGYIRSPGNNLVLDALDEATYTLVDSETLKVYENYDLSGDHIFKLEKGEQVTVTRVMIVGNSVHGYIEYAGNQDGWIDLAKMTKGAVTVKTETEPTATTAPVNQNVIGSNGNTGDGGFVNNAGGYKYTGKVINTKELNVRSSASTSAAKSAVLKSGANLVIYETTISEAMAWGRCDAGWVYLYYVDLTPASGNAVDARVVFNDNTIIYSDSGCTQPTGSTYARMAVVDIYEIMGSMARTEDGWIKTSDLL